MAKIKDHVHSMSCIENEKVFKKTYKTIEDLAMQISESQVKGFGVQDPKHIADICNMNIKIYSKAIIGLVNYSIEKFKKDVV